MHAPRLASACAGALALALAAPVSAIPQETIPLTLRRSADELIGTGPGYRARFASSGFSFAPTRAGRTADERTLRFTVLAAGRRSGPASAAAREAPSEANGGRFVRYDRGAFDETYELRRDGVEQSFVFATLPPGTGDLVVTGRIDTELSLVAARDTGLRFESPDGHGVRFGAVVGIDARGVTAPGVLRATGDVVEMSLPAAFVDAAELPLVLDPLIGSITPVAQGDKPAAAYSVMANQYLAAWQDGSPPTVSGALIQNDGTVLTPFAIAPTPPYVHASQPRVASVQAGFTAFGIASLGGTTLGAASTLVSAVDAYGNVIGTAPAGSLSDTHADPDIAGDVPGGDDEVLVVYQNVTKGVIQVTEFELDTLQSWQTINLTTNATTDARPAISASGGAAGRYLVTWEREVGGKSDIYGAVIDRNLNVLVSAFPIALSPADEDDPVVDGDGTNWLVGFEREPTEGSGNNNIYCQGVTYDAGSASAYLSTVTRNIGTNLSEEHNVAVAWTGESYLIGFADEVGPGDFDLFVKSRESFECRSCEGKFSVAYAGDPEDEMTIASQVSGGATGNEALILWAVDPSGIRPPLIEHHRFQAADGAVVDLGGGCAGGGTFRASCALEGAARFGLGVQHANASTPAALLLGAAPTAVPCGACTLVVNPVVSVPTVTDGNGNAAVNFGLQSGGFLGATLIAQYAILTPGPGCPVPFSNGSAVTIE